MAQGKKEEAEEYKRQVSAQGDTIEKLSVEEKEVEEKIKTIMMTIPNIIDPSVPIGKDDSENVELERYGKPVVQIMRFRITQKLWKNLTELIWKVQER